MDACTQRERRLFLVAYDVANAARLAHVHAAAARWSMSGQRSVFECWLTPAEWIRLVDALRRRLDESCDRLLVVRLDARQGIWGFGRACVQSHDETVVIA